MKNLLFGLLTMLLSVGCSPIQELLQTGKPTINSNEYITLHENGIEVFTGQYDLTKYVEIEYSEYNYIGHTITLRFKDVTPTGYYKAYTLNSVKICQEKTQTALDKMELFLIDYIKSKGGSAILNPNLIIKEVCVQTYGTQKIYSNKYFYSFTILKLK